MKYYLIAGESSGDLHGSNLIKELKQLDNKAEFRGWGGDLMEKEGMYNVVHINQRAIMGFIEVIKHILKIRKWLQLCKKDILKYNPDKVIFIDYPGFNLKIAEFTHQHQFENHYYISPKVWAWNTKRALKIKKIIQHMYVIFSFEVGFYKQFDYKVHYVGNPLLDAIDNYQNTKHKTIEASKPILLLLPGSRNQEIKNIFPEMAKAVDEYREQFHIAVALAPGYTETDFQNIYPNQFNYYQNQTYQLLSQAYIAIVTSGTATLETALFNIPQIVCYKTSFINYSIGKMLIKVPFISLVNLVAEEKIVEELIQDQCNPIQINKELKKLILQKDYYEKMRLDYLNVIQKLNKKNASKETARLIFENTKHKLSNT